MNNMIIENFLKPVNALCAVGEDASYEFCYEIMESEIKKIESLFGGSIDWELVQRNAIDVLLSHSKDIKVACYFTRAMVHLHGIDGLKEGLTLLLALISHFGESLHPQRKRAREGAIEWLDQQLALMLPKIEKSTSFFTGLSQCDELIKQIQHDYCQAFQEEQCILNESASLICALLKNKNDPHLPTTSAVSKEEKSPSTPSMNTFKQATKDNTKEISRDTDFLSFDASKKTLKKLAKNLLSSNPKAAISYQLHRYLTWKEIDNLPPHENKITSLYLAVSKEKVLDYREDILHNGDIALLKELEETLTDCPFWITGHHLVSSLLEKLGLNEAAQTVHTETRRFIQSLPDIENLFFNNSEPFADSETKKWLTSALHKKSAPTQKESLYQAPDDILKDLFESNLPFEDCSFENLGKFIAPIAQKLECHPAERDQFLLHLQVITVFLNLGLLPLCLPYLENLWRISEETKLENWEPSLFEKMKDLIKRTLGILYPNKEALPHKYLKWQFIYSPLT